MSKPIYVLLVKPHPHAGRVGAVVDNGDGTITMISIAGGKHDHFQVRFDEAINV